MSDYLSHTCCLPESGTQKPVNAEDALDLESRGVLCAVSNDAMGMQTINAQCPGPLYYPTTTFDESGLPQCHCSLWDKPLPMMDMEGKGHPTEQECLAKCEQDHMHMKIQPHMPVDMIGGKCVPASSDAADYPSYLGGLETCCLVGDFVEGYDADVWGPGSLCNRLFPQEKVWLQVPWYDGVQRLCKQVPKRDVEERYPGIKECKEAYKGLVDGDAIPPCYVNDKDLPHGRPEVRQCWTGIEGVGEQSPACPPGMECGFMPSCVAYPAITPVLANGGQFSGLGGPTSNTCHISHPGKFCRQDIVPYLKQGKQVGYQCGPDGQVTCCVQDMTSGNIIYPTVEDVAYHMNCPGAIDLTSCPTCPPPTSDVDTCKIIPSNQHKHLPECAKKRPHINPHTRERECDAGCYIDGGKCYPHNHKFIQRGDPCTATEECRYGLSCVFPPGAGKTGKCEPYSHM